MNDILKQEIFEQPDVVRNLVERQAEPARRIASELAGRFDQVMIAARGTSDNAARYATYLLGARNRLPVALAVPSLFTLYNSPPRLVRTLLIGISQSGQSPDIIQVVEEARRQGQPTLAITNDDSSPLAKASEYILPLGCGSEKAVAATKTYTASLGAVALLSAGLSGDVALLDQLHAIPAQMAETLSASWEAVERMESKFPMDYGVVIGRGFNYATAFEIALKIKELSGMVAEPYSPADFRHGPISMIRPDFPVIIVAPGGQTSEDMHNLYQELEKAGAFCMMITDQPEKFNTARLTFKISEDTSEYLTPLLAILPGQIIARRLAKARGMDPNAPRGLTKVTFTW